MNSFLYTPAFFWICMLVAIAVFMVIVVIKQYRAPAKPKVASNTPTTEEPEKGANAWVIDIKSATMKREKIDNPPGQMCFDTDNNWPCYYLQRNSDGTLIEVPDDEDLNNLPERLHRAHCTMLDEVIGRAFGSKSGLHSMWKWGAWIALAGGCMFIAFVMASAKGG